MVTVEELPIGVLTWVADDLNTTDGLVGLTVSVAGVLGAIAALGAPLLMRGADRRLILLGALLLSAAACVMSAFAPNIGFLLFSRVFVGIAIGAFWTVAPLVGLRLATPADAGKATAVIFGGGGVATILGVPIGSFIASLLHWRGAFVALAVFSIVNAIVVLFTINPTRPVSNHLPLADYFKVLRHPLVLCGVVTTFMLAISHYSVLTYATSILQDHAGIRGEHVGAFLFLAGVAGLAGNATSGIMMRKNPLVTMPGMVVLLAGGLALIIPVAQNFTGTIIVMICWGFAGSTLASGLQGWINQSDETILEPATGLNSASFNLAIAVGAAAGGYVVDNVGLTTLPPAAAAFTLTALLPFVWYRWVNRTHRAQAASR